MTVSKDSYFRLIENRPYKFDESEVNYRKSDAEERCGKCFHFFERLADGFNVCEIFRPTKGSESINPKFVCQFFTEDGEEFPLLKE